jgi:hypothetical protein
MSEIFHQITDDLNPILAMKTILLKLGPSSPIGYQLQFLQPWEHLPSDGDIADHENLISEQLGISLLASVMPRASTF